MRNFTLLILGAALCCGQADAARNLKTAKFITPCPVSSKMKKSDAKRQILKKMRAGNAAIWKAAHEEAFFFDGEEWLFDGSYDTEYDKSGKPVLEKYTDFEGNVTNHTYKYDGNGQCLERISVEIYDGEEQYSERKTYTYDEKVTDFKTSEISYQWDGDDWAESYGSFKRPVQRNADGNVTEFSVFVPFMGKYDEIERTQITYDATTGKADTYKFMRLDYDENFEEYWNAEYDIFDIEWENTDGQIVKDWDALVLGNNRVKKASYNYDGEFDGYRIASYTEGKIDFEIDETDADSNVLLEHNYLTTDENGSFREDIYEYFGEEAYHNYQTVTYNDKGDVLLSEQFEEMGEDMAMLMGGERNTYTYDEATGVMTEVVSEMYDADMEDYIPFIKIVYSGIIDAAGVGSVVGNQAKLQCSTVGNSLRIAMEGMTGYAVYDLSGAMVCAAGTSGDVAEISLDTVAKGAYIVKATGSKGFGTAKFINR